ncbi:MAG: tRNA lysidine(34) synthetase TilS, partial [Thermodesulfobacteriota bacterium]
MLYNQIKRAIDCHHLVEKGDRLIVGVSGGVDSMVLLHLLNACREAFDLSLIVAHVNHGLRPVESEKEAELVQKEAARLGLPFEYGQFNVKEFQKRGGLSPQDAARRVRFHFFHNLLQKHHAQKIALGHHADDQVETVLLRLIRGSGLQGLKGMLPIRDGKVIRPLLGVWEEEIQSFAMEKKIPFLSDSSNLKKDYLRNRIRLALIPMMEREYQPNFKEILLRTSNILR